MSEEGNTKCSKNTLISVYKGKRINTSILSQLTSIGLWLFFTDLTPLK